MKKITAADPESQSPDLIVENLTKLRELFPELVTEGPSGRFVNVDVLKQLVGDQTLTDAQEKYGLNWHGKRQARQLALTPSTGTLRPCPEDSVDWDTTQNLMIEGDNLEVLKLLQKSYAGKVKLIYIDPPYNTGKDFVYPDNFQDNIKNYLEITGQVGEGGQKLSSNSETSGRFHTDWLNMMYPRLKLARNLLREDGVIFISIDDNEVENVQLLCNEIFGEENFLAVLVWKCRAGGGSDSKHFATDHEYSVVYAKQRVTLPDFSIPFSDEQQARFNQEDSRGKYYLKTLERPEQLGTRPNLQYPIQAPDGSIIESKTIGKKYTWVVSEDKLRTLLKEDRVVFKNGRSGWMPYRKLYLHEGDDGEVRGLKPRTVLSNIALTRDGGTDVERLFDSRDVCTFPKPVRLIEHLLAIAAVDHASDLILDFFAGSGTTGHSVMMMNARDNKHCKYLLVQLPEPLDPENKDQKIATDFCDKLGKPRNIAELTKERLRRAAKKIKEENPLFAGDLGFRVFKLDSTNVREWDPDRANIAKNLEDAIDHLKENRSEYDILFELLLKLGLDLCVPIEQKKISGHTVHSVGAGTLIVCLSEQITKKDVEPLAQGIIKWHKEMKPAGETTIVFRDAAFPDNVAKTNLTAILAQSGLETVRSL
jgi:adenine-specific DNA-methyltransferase